MPKGRYRNVNPSAIALLFGGPRPANKLKLALARAEEPTMDEDENAVTLDAEQAKLVKRLVTPATDEKPVEEAAASLSDDDKAALLGATRLVAGIDRAVVARAMDCQGMHCPGCGEEAAMAAKAAAAARAMDGLPAEVVARMRGMEEEIAQARAAVATERATREKAEAVTLARAELAHLPGAPVEATADLLYRLRSKLEAKEYGEVLARFKAASAAIQAGGVLTVHGRDVEGAPDAGEGNAWTAAVKALAREQKCSEGKAAKELVKTEQGRALYRAANERS